MAKMHQDASLKRMGNRLALGALAALALFLVAVTFGTWRVRSVPVDPTATMAVLAYMDTLSAPPDSVTLRDQQGRCGWVRYRDRSGPLNSFQRFLVDRAGEVELDSHGLLPSFEQHWQASPCWTPPGRRTYWRQ